MFQKLLTTKFFTDLYKTVYNLNIFTTKVFCLGKKKGKMNNLSIDVYFLCYRKIDKVTLLSLVNFVVMMNTKMFSLHQTKPNLRETSIGIS